MTQRHTASGLGLFLLASLLPAAAHADEAAAEPFVDTHDIPTVLSATRLQQSLLEVPAAVTVIDRQMIEQSGVREIPEILRLVPGMVVGYDTGSEAFVSLHGTAADRARRMQVLVDGRSIYQPLLAQVDWIGLPLELSDIERIEVIRGPNSAAWGANSFFGVINIITRHPADVDRARLSATRGTDGVEDFTARVAHRTASVDWRLTMAGRSDSGFEYNPKKQQEFADDKDVNSVYGRAVWAPQDSSSLEFAFGAARMEAEQEYRPTFFLEPPVADRDNEFLSLAWEQDAGQNNRLRVQGSHSRFRRDEPWRVSLPPAVFNASLGELYKLNRSCANKLVFGNTACYASLTSPQQALADQFLADVGWNPLDPARLGVAYTDTEFSSGLDADERRTQIDLQDTWMVSPDLRAVFGVTYDQASVDSQVYLGGHAENTVWRTFAHAEWRFAPEWLLNVGGNQEFDEGAGDFFSPRFALNWQFSDNQVLRAVYSEAVRTPDIFEEQADFAYVATAADPANSSLAGTFFQSGQSDGNAPTEWIESSELGYFGRYDPFRLSVDLRVYRNEMGLTEHSLDPTESDGFLIAPARPMVLKGGEFGMDWRPWPSQRFQVNYAYQDMDDALTEDDNGNFVPRHSGSLAWWQDYGNGLQFGNTYYYYNDLRTDKGTFFDQLDTRLAKRFLLPHNQQVQLALVMQNRLTHDPELRDENQGDGHRGWVSLDWRY